jgi:hypothetical protein
VLRIRIRTDPHWEYGSGSRRAEITQFLLYLDEEHNFARYQQCIRIRIRIHFGKVDPDPHWEYGSGFRRAKINHKSEENSLSFEVPEIVLF